MKSLRSNSAVAGLLSLGLAISGCGDGTTADGVVFAPEEITADEVRHRLSIPRGGFEYDRQSLDFELPALAGEAAGIARKLAPDEPVSDVGRPETMPRDEWPPCERGLFHGKWKALDAEVGVLFGALRDQNLDVVGRIAGIFGHGRVHGIVTYPDSAPRFLLSGRYGGGDLHAELLDKGGAAAGALDGIYDGQGRNGFFVGFWDQDCAPTPPPPPPPKCVEGVIEDSCQSAEQLRRKATAECERMGMTLTDFELGPACPSRYVTNRDCDAIDASVARPGILPVPCQPQGYFGARYTCCVDEPPRRCTENAQCDERAYCEKATCDNELGECSPKPGGCPEEYAPVCGCDDSTYSNRCEAASAGVNVAHDGACQQDDVCQQQPAVAGPCKAFLRRWTYHPERRQCEEFIYGGCAGNDNNFRTREACERRCRVEVPSCERRRLGADGSSGHGCFSHQVWEERAAKTCASEGLELADLRLHDPCPTFCMFGGDAQEKFSPCGPPLYGSVTFSCCKTHDEPPPPLHECFVGGCNGELCTDREDIEGICLWSPHFSCYDNAECGHFGPDGGCAWKPTDELQDCLGKARQP